MDNDTEVHFCQQGGSLASPKCEFEWNLEDSANHTAWPLRASGCFVRRDVALMFSAQAQKLGIPSNFGVGVTNYLEDSAMGLGIIHTEDGRELSADIVVAADGFGTESHFVVVDYPTRAISTGYCIDYPTSMLKNTPALSKALAELLHIFTDDDGSATESWSTGVTPEQMAAAIPGLQSWDHLLAKLIKNTPPDTIVRRELCLRNPQPKWTSESGCIVQTGDAARSLLPTSANGAAMALEDSMSLADCLRLGGKEEAVVATKVHQDLRFNHRELHNTSMKQVTKGGKAFLFYGNTELGNGFKNTNLPRRHVFEDWTMDSQLAKEMQVFLYKT
ncbi:hypothetical protein M752DRAFT_287229 [Aspergillus phoenicis ATCC 13157]|uniref:FAD/NAD(P)-binding domain-containing protein n=1 Tax=Aspergillus phoenicis ATCC 13157 TaxID=1353007 RepID=A0A370P5E7_ASPPH|nr:hypothetical protein M752DRAFT_287229 [Aspergillus phoenicis ATCC 13157]